MKILALDIATKAGWALYEGMGRGVHPRIRCGSWHCGPDSFDRKCAALGAMLDGLLKEEGPIVYAGIEAPLMVIPTGSGRDMFGEHKTAMLSTAATIGVLHALIGSAVNSLRRAGVPWRMVTPVEWRKSFVGVTRAPATVAKKDGSKYLKRVVREEADRLAHQYGFHVPNMDASDAVGIAFWLRANVLHFIAEDELLARVAA